MNNKGQAGLIFIALIPIIFISLAFVYDNALMVTKNNEFKSTSKIILKEVLNSSSNLKEEEVKNLYKKNNYPTDKLNVIYNGESLIIYNIYEYPSFFGNVLGIKNYHSEINIKGTIVNNKIIIEENKEE